MIKTPMTAVAFAAMLAMPMMAHADDSAKKPDAAANPKSSAAATPDSAKHSAGTVGAMKNAGDGSFTASEADKKKDLTKSK